MTGKPLVPYDEVKGTRDARRDTKAAMRTPLKKVNKERGGQRVTEGRDPDYLAWNRTRRCKISGVKTGEWFKLPDGTAKRALVVAAHMVHGRTSGTDQTALPIEESFHDARWGPNTQHRLGTKAWAKLHNLDVPALIALNRKEYALDMAEKVKAKK